MVNPDPTLAEEEEFNRLDELDGIEGPPKKSFKNGFNQEDNPKPIEFNQAPIVPCVYTDETNQEKCMVVFMLYTGVKGITVDIIVKPNLPEQLLRVTYNWFACMYDVVSIFKNDENGRMLVPKIDPKVIAVQAALKQYKGNMEEAPMATCRLR